MSTTNPARTDLRSNPGLRGKRRVTNRLSHGIANRDIFHRLMYEPLQVQCPYAWLVMIGRLKYRQQNQWCLSRVPLRLRWLLKRLRDTSQVCSIIYVMEHAYNKKSHQALIKFQQNLLNQEIRKSALRSINLLILLGRVK
jgi:hypothetical protein